LTAAHEATRLRRYWDPPAASFKPSNGRQAAAVEEKRLEET
jgi:hypothetical protein